MLRMHLINQKNGNAAFLEKRTTLYAVKDHPGLLAVKFNN